MDNLYKDIYNHIFSFLSHRELINLMLVSKQFYHLVDNLNLPNVDFNTVCEKGYYLNIKKLGLKNQNLNKALFFATKGGHWPIDKLLISNGANNWVLAFNGACYDRHIDLIDFMYQNIVKDYNKIFEQINNCKDTKFKNFIYRYLPEFVNIKSVESLINDNLDIWNMGLYCVCKTGNQNLIDYFISKGANPERGISGACNSVYIDLIDYLITKGATVYDFVLYYACKSGRKDVVDYIIPKIQKDNIDYNYGLEGACKIGNKDLIEFMISKGANNWNRALKYACKSGNRDIVEYIIQQGVTYLDLGLYAASQYGHKDIVEYMIQMGANKFNRALQYACKGGHIDIVEYLVQLGANDWNRGLIAAWSNGHTNIVEYLVKKDVNDLTRGLILACKKGYKDIVNLLITKLEKEL